MPEPTYPPKVLAADAAQPALPEPATEPLRSDAFERLFKSEDDLAGALAYAFYKREKREFLIKNGLAANDPRALQYHSDLNATRVTHIRELAELKLQEYSDNVTAKATAGMHEQVLQNVMARQMTAHHKELAAVKAEVIKSGSWWRTILVGVLASAAFATILTWADFVAWTNPFSSRPPHPSTPASTPASKG